MGDDSSDWETYRPRAPNAPSRRSISLVSRPRPPAARRGGQHRSMVWDGHRHRGPKASRDAPGRRETPSRDDGQGRISRAHPRCVVPARRRARQRFTVVDPSAGSERPTAFGTARRPACPRTTSRPSMAAVIGPSAGFVRDGRLPRRAGDRLRHRRGSAVGRLPRSGPAARPASVLVHADPVLGRQGIGDLRDLLSRTAHAPSPQEQNVIEQITHLASIAVERAQGEELLREQAQPPRPHPRHRSSSAT